MSNRFAHFAINADDVTRACAFYEAVFGWKPVPWGPPGFFQLDMGAHPPVKIIGALQQRREIVPGVPMRGFECTIAVDNLAAIEAAIEANGGKIVMPKMTIPTVGDLLFFEDPEGNIAGAIQFVAESA
jgi:predicted enzyme related to lactoylglutathione lyase